MANARLGKQAGGLVFALGVQALFALLLLWSLAPATQRQLAHEMILLLRPKTKPAPPVTVIDASHSAPNATQAPTTAMPQAIPDYSTPLTFAPQANVQGLNPGLADCAPENSRNMSAEARASCAHQGMIAARPPPNADPLASPPDHVKDRATWEEQWAEDHFTYGPCSGANSIAVGVPPDLAASPVTDCLLKQYTAENDRAAAARQAIADAKAAARAEPKIPLPHLPIRGR